MTTLTLTITDAGRAALVNAGNTGTDPVTMAEIGLTETAFAATPAATALPGEFKRLSTFSGAAVAADTVHITIRDDSATSYTLRGFGLYLDDGTLFAVYGQSGAIMQKTAQSLLLLSVDIKLLQVAASAITFGNANFLNPPATTDVHGVIELATPQEATAGTDTARAITPATLKGVLNTHQQPWARITGKPAPATRWPKWSEVSDKPGTFAPNAHGHVIADVSGLQGALNGKLNLTGGTLTNTLTVKGSYVAQATDSKNAVLLMCDAQGGNRGNIFWNRNSDHVQISRYDPETGQTAGWARINANNTFQTSHAITAPGFNGKATSADKLHTARTINGTAFNGTANIITGRWGAERTLKIGNASKPVNGSGNVTWTLAEIGAAPAGHGHAINDVGGLQDALNGKANISGAQYTGLHHFTASHVAWGQAPAETIRVELGPGTSASWLVTGAVGVNFRGGVQMLGSGAALRLYANSHYAELDSGGWKARAMAARNHMSIATPAGINAWLHFKAGNSRTTLVGMNEAGRNGFYDLSAARWQMYLDDEDNAVFRGTVTAPGFNGKATSADRLHTARTLKIGSTGKAFDGSGNVTWTPAEMGYSGSKTTNGWMKRPDGIIEQWGLYLIATTTETTRSVTFPITFPTDCLNVTVSDLNPVGPNNKNNYDMYAQVNNGSLGQSGFSVYIQGPGSGSWNWVGMYWRAIGH